MVQVMEATGHDMGFDAANECMVNLIEKGIIDPTKVPIPYVTIAVLAFVLNSLHLFSVIVKQFL